MDQRNATTTSFFFLTAAAAFTLLNWLTARDIGRERALGEMMTYLNVRHIVEDNYVEPFDADAFHQGALRGALKTLDEHSSYMGPPAARDFEERTEAHFGGIGVHITIEDGYLSVVTPWKGTPAYKAGLLAGDRIVSVDGEKIPHPLDAEHFRRVIEEKIKGEADTVVRLGIFRPETGKELEIKVKRGRVHIPSVLDRRIILQKPPIAYLQLKNFTGDMGQSRSAENSVNEVVEALRELERKSPGGKLAGLVFDLRGNHGGLLVQAVAICNLFITKGVIVSSRDRSGTTDRWTADPDSTLWPDLPLVVLIDGESASASEIVAGCLSDYHRAVLIGERSYGKASVQKTFPINLPPVPESPAAGKGGGSNGEKTNSLREARIKVTVAKYYTPSGKDIHHKGIEPDIKVRLTPREKNTLVLMGNEVFLEVNRLHPRPGAEQEAVKKFLAADTQLETAIKFLEETHNIAPERQKEILRRIRAEVRVYNTIGLSLDASAAAYAERYIDYIRGLQLENTK